MSNPVAYLNGQFIFEDAARLHLFDMGVVGGTSVTEMVRTFRHEPFRLDQHLNRLQQSLDALEIRPGLQREELRDLCCEVVARNAALIPAERDLGLIVFVTTGLNPTYVGQAAAAAHGPTVGIHTFSLPFENWRDSYQTGVHLVTVSTRAIPEEVLDPRIKHRSRAHWHQAAREAVKRAPGAVAVLQSHDELLTETAAANLCVVDGATIITPSRGVLEGVSRDYVGELAVQAGFTFVHGAVSADDLAHADEAFLTSTPSCLLPVTRFNNQPIADGEPGPVFTRLLTDWSAAVGVEIASQS